MRRGVFVTGTDTGVGKTVLSAALMHRFRAETAVCYWKPVQTGVGEDDDTLTVERLGNCQSHELLRSGIRLSAPLSPHLAARLEGRAIEVSALVRLAASAPCDTAWIVEGAGGVLVPLSETEWLPDLIRALALPVVVAARGTLGTINHTLLTLEALRHRELPIAGVVVVGRCEAENRSALERWSGAPLVGAVPSVEPLNSQGLEWAARTHLDPAGRLLPFLTPSGSAGDSR